jgi:hypothetical protein
LRQLEQQVIYVPEVVKKRDSWEGVATQRGPEHGISGITIVRSRYYATTSEDSAGWKRLKCMCNSDL